MKKSILLLLVYWLTLAQKAEAQSHKFYYCTESNLYYEIIGKQGFYNKKCKWNSSSVLPLTFKLSVSDRVALNNGGGIVCERKDLM